MDNQQPIKQKWGEGMRAKGVKEKSRYFKGAEGAYRLCAISIFSSQTTVTFK